MPKANVKQWFHSWTLWFNGLLLLGAVYMQVVYGTPVPEQLAALVSPEILLLATGAINLALRFKTKTAVSLTAP